MAELSNDVDPEDSHTVEDSSSHMLVFDRNGPFKRKRVRRHLTTKPGHALLSIQYSGS
jgi:hypothetical protein